VFNPDEISYELCRRNADDCCERAMQARTPESRPEWLKIAEEWEKLVRDVPKLDQPGTVFGGNYRRRVI
jgi:hypothetical protein